MGIIRNLTNKWQERIDGTLEGPAVDVEESMAGSHNVKNSDVWPGTKATDNPKIAPGDNADANDEQYEAAPARAKNGDIYMFVKSDEISTNDSLFRLWKSTDDGASWTKQSTTFSPSDSSLDASDIRQPVLVRDDDTWHLWYRVADGTDNNVIGHASGTDITSLNDDSNNPVLTESDVNSGLGGDQVEGIRYHDVVKKDGKVLFYGSTGSVTNTSSTSGVQEDQIFFVAEATSFSDSSHTAHSTIISNADVPRSGNVLGGCAVFRQHGAFYMFFTAGRGAGTTGTDHRETYCLVGDGYNFNPVMGTVVDTGATGTWEERWTYGGAVLKEQSGGYDRPDRVNGKIQFYYNGSDTTSSNNGSIGLIEFDNAPHPSNLSVIEQKMLALNSSTVDTTSTSAGNYASGRTLIPGGYPVAILDGYATVDTSGDEARVAFHIWDRSGNGEADRLGETAFPETGARQYTSAPFNIPKGGANALLQLWGNDADGDGSSPTATCYTASIRLFSSYLREDGTIR